MNSKQSVTAKGRVFVIAAPSGTGKTTICRRILERDPRLRLSVSHTTRKPRAGEKEGLDYHFVSEEAFRALREADGFLESAKYVGNTYGTSWQAIEAPLEVGVDVVLEIEVQGAAQVRRRLDDACLIFLLPPSLEALEERLLGRGTDDEAVIRRRLALVGEELKAAKIFDYAVVNDDLERAVMDVLAVVAAVREGRSAEIAPRFGRESVLERWNRAQPT